MNEGVSLFFSLWKCSRGAAPREKYMKSNLRDESCFHRNEVYLTGTLYAVNKFPSVFFAKNTVTFIELTGLSANIVREGRAQQQNQQTQIHALVQSHISCFLAILQTCRSAVTYCTNGLCPRPLGAFITMPIIIMRSHYLLLSLAYICMTCAG